MSEISYEMPKDKRFKNLSGQVFGRLTVLEWSHKKQFSYYLCMCECGNNVVIQSTSLRNGATVSCGCYRRERASEIHTTHGLTNHPIYDRCVKIIQRCYNPNNEYYHYYGGRGITVFESWRNDIGLMVIQIETEIGLPPTPKHEIDRINVNGGYEPDNIRWVTREENQRNKRNTHNQARDPVTRKTTATYNAWRRLLRWHGDEVCAEWKDDKNPETTNGFRQFFEDMGEKPNLGYRKHSPLMRYDETKPWCRENCYWS